MASKKLTPTQFAANAGVSFHRCDPVWGGTWGYSSLDHPNSRYNGYDTRAEALAAWGANTFGPKAWAALASLLNN